MKQKLLLSISIVITLFISVQGFSQNLVRNWSFEDTVSCPTSVAQINKAHYWFTPRGDGGSSELFSSCHEWNPPHSGSVGVPVNILGFQLPKLGANYSGITCYVNSETREYIETKLSQVMSPQINYYVEFWVSLSNASSYAIENVGAYFSRDTLHYSSSLTTLIDAQVEYSKGIISDTLNWVKVSGYFKPPNEGYQFLTIGNFNVSDSTNKILVGWNTSQSAYYYIENVAVIDSALQHTIGIASAPLSNPKVKVYPNPATNTVNIAVNDHSKGKLRIEIYTLNGQMVKARSFYSSDEIRINTEDLNSSLYFIKIYNEEKVLGVQKLIIQKL